MEQMDWEDLAKAVLMKALQDATSRTVDYMSAEYPTKLEQEKARRFLRGLGKYSMWLSYWCDIAGIDESSVKKLGEQIEGGNYGKRIKMYSSH